ncbi:MAG: hypothetical protein QOJ30_4295 [Pseudonocardiales bacterium]|jgi:hypothetical protein|nr:hypothetical protein [Pseudonocardiales bacterium]
MTGRILRTELRRSTAPWLGVVFVLLSLALLFGLTGPWVHGSAPWTEQWTGLALWQRNLLSFTWPVVLGLSTWQGTRQSRSTMDELLATTPRPAWCRVGVLAGAMAIAVTVAALVLFTIGAVQVAGSATYFTFDWLPTLAVGILAMIAAVALGMAIGHLLPYVATPPMVAVAGEALLILLLSVPSDADATTGSLPTRVTLLSPVLDGPDTAFTTVSPPVHLGQALFFLGLAATGFALLTVRGLRARIAAGLPAVLGLVLALIVLPGQQADAYPDDVAAAAPVCDESGPQVCVTAAHQGLLPAFTGPGRQALADLAVLPNAPISVREVPDQTVGRLAPLPRPADTIQADLNDGETRHWSGPQINADRLRLTLLVGAGTAPCAGYATRGDETGGIEERAARLAVVSWLSGDPAQPGSAATPSLEEYWPEVARKAESARDALFALPRDEQVRRVAALRQAGLTCEGDQWDILARGTGAR